MSVSPLNRHSGAASFDDFYRQFFVRVLVLVRRHFPGCDAEEIAQETMARCYTSYGTLDPGRDPWPWVNSVARNAAIDSLRRNRRNVSAEELPELPAAVEDTTYDAVLVLERRRSVRTALKRLRPADRQLLEDHDLEGMCYTEMAALRDMTPNALRQQLFRARGRLAVELRRVGATLGLVPLAIHDRVDRLARKANDLSCALGPVSASALSVAAVAGVATVATVLTGPAAPLTAQANRPADVVRVAAPQPEAARPADVRRDTASVPVAHRPVPPDPPPPLPITIRQESHGDPTKPDQPYEGGFFVDTPVGPVGAGVEWGSAPGQGLLCFAGQEESCDDDEEDPPPP